MDLLCLKRKAHLQQDHWVGAAEDGGSEVGLPLTKGQTEGKDRCLTSLFWPHKSVQLRGRGSQLHSPHVWPGGATTAWRTQAEQKNQNVRDDISTPQKKSNPLTRMKLRSRGEEATYMLAVKVYPISTFQSCALSVKTMILNHCRVWESPGEFFL